ncbi:dephospho-CoA kinase [Angomonas deanei]|nr:dephospho-CoA kinase [Angomonas deanei]|eukprot:EPY26163.1 dephospho-CoA kinase [Angomonas deanei]
MILIGLTGGIACGKSTVSTMLRDKHHLVIIDADEIVRDVQKPFAPCTRKIGERWPGCVDPTTGELNRAELGKIIFEDREARKALAGIMNGPIFRAIFQAIFRAWLTSSSGTVVVLDAPTLFETGVFTYFISNSLVIACTEEKQMERLKRRNDLEGEDARNRIRSQMSLERKKELAGYVINNDDSTEALATSVEDCVLWMKKQSRYKFSKMVYGALLAACVLPAGLVWWALSK